MKTKDFIKMLQDADPSGEAHVRMDGGIPKFAELKAGYWDGPYRYIDENGDYVYSTKGSKVDIYCTDIWDFVECLYGRDVEWEDIKKKFKFELNYSIKEQREERENIILNEAKEAYEDIKKIEDDMYEKELSDMTKNAEKGWTWFQNKDVDKNEKPNYHVYYTWKIYDENGKEDGSSIYNTEPVLRSGLWEKCDNGVKKGYYQWIKK